MKLKLFAILLLVVVGGAAVFIATGGIPSSAAAATTYLTANATVTDVTDDIAATGNVAAATSWNLAFGVAPTTGTASSSSSSSAASNSSGTWTVGDVKVKVGDAVTAKEVLATARNSSLAESITAAKNSVTSAHLQLDNAQDTYDNASGTTAVRQARIGLLNA
ncbi:MAG TPA: hypothetical protein VFP22_02235, partial [Candidatus Limnocylindrales bacterium]|nr:hypothetical protein [Candidatus Limnocylindrales bacterium]